LGDSGFDVEGPGNSVNQENTNRTDYEKIQDADNHAYAIENQPFYVINAAEDFSVEEVEEPQVGYYNQALGDFDDSYPLYRD